MILVRMEWNTRCPSFTHSLKTSVPQCPGNSRENEHSERTKIVKRRSMKARIYDSSLWPPQRWNRSTYGARRKKTRSQNHLSPVCHFLRPPLSPFTMSNVCLFCAEVRIPSGSDHTHWWHLIHGNIRPRCSLPRALFRYIVWKQQSFTFFIFNLTWGSIHFNLLN